MLTLGFLATGIIQGEAGDGSGASFVLLPCVVNLGLGLSKVVHTCTSVEHVGFSFNADFMTLNGCAQMV